MKKKSLILFMVVLIVIESIFPIFSSAYEISSADIIKVGTADYHLKYFNESKGMSTYVICNIVGYYNNGVFHPAYCMNNDLPGVDDKGYSVNISDIIRRDDVWRVVTNGYPYKSAAEIGVDNDNDAFVVTKMAVYCITGQSYLDRFSYNENDSEAHRMYDALVKLVNIGHNSSITRNDGTFSIEKQGEFTENGNYFEQQYKINSTSVLESYEVKDLLGFPDGTQIVNLNNNPQYIFSFGENFKVLIPKSGLYKDINGKFVVSTNLKTYPLFYGAGPSGRQDYLLTFDAYEKEQKQINMDIVTNTGSVKVKKIDKDSGVSLSGVEFELTKENSSEKYNSTTDNNGEIIFSNLYPGNYILTEIKTGENYILNEEHMNINVEYNKESFIQVGNEAKKGTIKIIKTDKDTKEPIKDVEFEVIDRETGEILEILVTNEKGIATTDLRIDKKYALKELSKNKEYIVNEKEYHFIVIEDGVTEVNIENEKIPNEPQEPDIPERPSESEKPKIPENHKTPEQPKQEEINNEPRQEEKIILPRQKKLPKTGM